MFQNILWGLTPEEHCETTQNQPTMNIKQVNSVVFKLASCLFRLVISLKGPNVGLFLLFTVFYVKNPQPSTQLQHSGEKKKKETWQQSRSVFLSFLEWILHGRWRFSTNQQISPCFPKGPVSTLLLLLLYHISMDF